MENGVSICTKRRFSECCAKVVLETYFNDRYCDLLLSDKPDLFDEKNKIGVEVIEAVDEKNEKRKPFGLKCRIRRHNSKKEQKKE